MNTGFIPIEAIAGLWEIVTCIGTVLVASFLWMFQPR